ncbi:FtsX-like permease family protein [Pseudohalocynthiibacter sp. F2068]|jgi:putative ABC transport system permease protein|uniref:ABC transporter permease n=1 Tax=Pseudohalocynthiibacter sp. F2068 TaxID=2926418 RepID=UPI001FF494AD|nr:FtsX-like permease family protein [Pseudohalocynthiibacter sp. F2068]MCK0102715.1 FtsX-like permease family protein [Pseudohalocynthiibacter sp. F2068]
MSLSVAARIARRELRGGIKGFRVFLACLALGVGAIAAIGTVRDSIEAGLEREGAAMLGGDVSLEFTYRFANPAERDWMQSAAEDVSEIVDFRSMAVVERNGTTERGLTQVKGVDDLYPIYGAVELSPEMPLEQAFAGKNGIPGAVMDPVLMDRLTVRPGDVFRLGLQDYILMAELTREPDSTTAGFTLGPRTLVLAESLSQSGLLQPGTLFESEYRLRLDPETNLTTLNTEAARALEGSGFRWHDRRNGAPGISRFVERLSAFLVLVGLSGLAVGGVGVSAAVRAYLDQKTAVIATLKTLGAESRTVFQVYFIQIGVLTLLGVLIGLAIGVIAPLVFAPIISARLPIPTAFGVYPMPLVEAALYGFLTAALFTLWPLARVEKLRAAALFREASGRLTGWPRPLWLFVTAGFFALLVGSAVAFSGQFKLTLWALGGILAAFVALVIMAALTRQIARRLARMRALRGRTTLRMALGAVGGPGGETTSVVLSLGLGLSVLAAVGQIDWNLRSAIARDLPDVAPSYFVVDIQNDQLAELRHGLLENPAVSNFESAPMLRGVITEINGLPAREVGGDHWVLNGDRGLTYSAEPPEKATVTAGEWWPADYNGTPQISFAAEEADELGLRLGDTLTINVLGRDITADITSLREVDFSTAGIGFVLSMNPAALQGAPHTHIATIYADQASEGVILRDLANTYPNVTAIRVRDAVQRVSDVLEGIAAAVTYGALATLITGGIVLIGAATAGERARTYEAAILKTLGASRRSILANFALRSALLGFAAGGVAVGAGALAGWGVTRFVMETDYSFEPVSALAVILGGILATLVAGLIFSWRPLAARPAQVLRAQE